MFFRRSQFSLSNQQKRMNGSALMVAIFVIVIMTLLGTALVNMQSKSSEAIAQEVLGTRALAAARSGMQAKLQRLFPLTPNAGRCSSGSSIYDLSSIPGLLNCSATVSCVQYGITIPSVAGEPSYYRLTATGTCGNGIIESDSTNVVNSSRTIQVEARSM